jgi:chemosensory pili system protein ChpA (sensor histidine kinase/response regulator)
VETAHEDIEQTEIIEKLATDQFESVPQLDEQVEENSADELPLIEAVDYDDIELAEASALDLESDNIPLLSDTEIDDVQSVNEVTTDDIEVIDFESVDIDSDEAEEITLELPGETSDEDLVVKNELLEDDSLSKAAFEITELSERSEPLSYEPELVDEDINEGAAIGNSDEEIEWESGAEEELVAQNEGEEFHFTFEDDADIGDDVEETEEPIDEDVEENIIQEPVEPVKPVVTQQVHKPAAQQATSFADVNNEDYDPEIIEIFIEEAVELLEDMERALHEWQEDWSNTDSVEELKRCLHTFKGGARLAGLSNLGDLSHDYETMLIEMDANAELDQNFFKQLNTYQDQLHSGVDAVRNGLVEQVASESVGAVEDEVEELEEQFEPVDEDSAPQAEYSRPSLVVDNDRAQIDPRHKPNVLTFAPKPKTPSAPLPKIPGAEFGGSRQGSSGPAQVQHLAARRAGPQEVVKVSAELLEELVNLAGETSISRGRMEQQVSDLGTSIEEMDATIHRLQEQLRRLDIETEAQVLFRQEQMMQHEQFDPLEMDRYSQLQQLSRSLIESASDLWI